MRLLLDTHAMYWYIEGTTQCDGPYSHSGYVGWTLAVRMAAWVADAERQLAEHQREIDDIAFRLYGIEGEDRKMIEGGVSDPIAEILPVDEEEDES